MSKLSNCLNMIDLLSGGAKYTIKQLSEKLEVSPKMIRIYKDELEKAGIYVSSIKGPYGGYYLNDNYITILRSFTKIELNQLNDILSTDKSKYSSLLEKISLLQKSKSNNLTEEELIKYNKISKAIQDNNKLEILYYASKGTKRTRVVDPLQIFYFNNNWYLNAFCEEKQKLRRFRIEGIKKIKVLK